MSNITNISTALYFFEEAAIKHAEATLNGDYKTGNKNYDKVVKAVEYLKQHDSINELLKYLNHDVVGLRLTAATYLLSKFEKEGIKTLEAISKSADFFSFIAETTLSEWRKGNLKV